MAVIEFAGPSSADPDNGWANTARLLNCYREPVGDGNFVVKPVPGLDLFSENTDGLFRAMEKVDGTLYVVQGGKLFEVDDEGSQTELGDIPDSEDTSISGNNGKVTISAAGRYLVWDGEDLTEPETGAFSYFQDVTFFGQLTVLIENARRVQWSDVADPTTLDGLSFATTESRDDNNLRVMPIGAALWIFKETSIERWQQNGADIQAIPGSTIDTGLLSRNLLAPTPNGAFFVGNDGKPYLVQSGSLNPLPSVAVETSIASEDPISCQYYQDEGREVCVITFTSRPAWCFDLTTGEWHERPDFFIKGSAKAYGKWFVGRDALGVYEVGSYWTDFDPDYNLVCQMIGRTIENGGEWFTVSKTHLHASVGTIRRDDSTSTETEAKVALRYSTDKGFTWSSRKERSLGAIGQYDRQISWRTLGRFKQFTPQITWSEPAEVTISSKMNVLLS